jgi:hypothetical protein
LPFRIKERQVARNCVACCLVWSDVCVGTHVCIWVSELVPYGKGRWVKTGRVEGWSYLMVLFNRLGSYFFVFLNWFNILISKINFKKYCFNIFINTKINFYYSSNTTMENLDFLIFWRAHGKWPSVWLNNCFDLDNPTTCLV